MKDISAQKKTCCSDKEVFYMLNVNMPEGKLTPRGIVLTVLNIWSDTIDRPGTDWQPDKR